MLALSIARVGLAEKSEPKSASIPSGIKHAAWDSLLKKYGNERGLAAYGKWKDNQADLKALDDYIGQFAPKASAPAKGNERVASAINAYNAFAFAGF